MGKNTELAKIDSFAIAAPYEGMDQEMVDELNDELGDLDADGGIPCRKIKIPSGGGLAYEVEGEDEGEAEYMKEIVGVIVFTHRTNGYWPGAYGSGDDDKVPACSSMDGKRGVDRDTGVITDCDTCRYNQFGSAEDGGRGKACKNMRRLYIMLSGDPNFYLLSIPPTSARDVNRSLARIMGSKGIPYTGLIVSLKLERAQNANGVAYSKVVVEKKGLLPEAASTRAKEMRRRIKETYQNVAVTLDDYVDAGAAAQAARTKCADDFMEAEAADMAELPFN